MASNLCRGECYEVLATLLHLPGADDSCARLLSAEGTEDRTQFSAILCTSPVKVTPS